MGEVMRHGNSFPVKFHFCTLFYLELDTIYTNKSKRTVDTCGNTLCVLATVGIHFKDHQGVVILYKMCNKSAANAGVADNRSSVSRSDVKILS